MAVTRELVITYGSLVISTANSRFIDGKIQISKDYARTSVTFSFVINQTTEANFATEINTIEAAFRAPFRDLVIAQGAQTIIALKPSDNSGLNTKPTIAKSDSMADTGRSRRYTVTVECDMPADNVASYLANGLRESAINIGYSSSGRRTITISGVFTALSGNTARQQYEAIIDSYATSILTAIGGNYELADKPRTEADGTNKLLSFTHIYDELIYSQAGSSLDDPDLIRQQFSMGLIKNYPGDTPDRNVQRMVTVSASYDVSVNKSVTDLKGKWERIKTWIVTTVKNAFSITSVALIDEDVSINNDDNRITARLTLRGATRHADIIEHQITYSLETIFGKVLVPVWSGDSLVKYAYQGPATRRLTVSATGKLRGEKILPAEESLIKGGILTGGTVIQVSSRSDSRPLKIGQEPYTYTITEFSTHDVYELYKQSPYVYSD
jgi:hypothetical protein